MRAGWLYKKRCQALENWSIDRKKDVIAVADSNRSFGEVLRVICELYSAPISDVNWIRILRCNA